MLSKVRSFGLRGLDGYEVCIETDISNGMPCVDVLGLPDAVNKESIKRVESAIKNSGFKFIHKKLTINMAPADIKKEGPLYDLPIAIGILASTEQISQSLLEKFVIIGELSLDGNLRGVRGLMPLIISALDKVYKNIIIPKDNEAEAAYINGVVLSVDGMARV